MDLLLWFLHVILFVSLDDTANSISCECAKLLADALKKNSTLLHLDLGGDIRIVSLTFFPVLSFFRRELRSVREIMVA